MRGVGASSQQATNTGKPEKYMFQQVCAITFTRFKTTLRANVGLTLGAGEQVQLVERHLSGQLYTALRRRTHQPL